MKRFTIFAALAALLFAGCAQTPASKTTDASRRYLEAWVHVQKEKHPEYLWTQTGLGAWILEEEEGSGTPVGEFEDSLYLRVNYTMTDLYGNISGSTAARLAQQLGLYDEADYYGPEIWYAKGIYAGLEDIIKGMRPGGRRKVVIPSWLMTFERFNTLDEYLSASQDKNGSNSIYDVELVEAFNYVNDWELDSISRYLVRNFAGKYGTDPKMAKADSSGTHGLYYIREEAPSDAVELKDTTVYINYIGRLLNGHVFDTNIRDTAIYHGVFSSSRSYSPVSVSYGSSWSETKMDDNGIIKGFARMLWQMKSFEKGTGVFYSPLGYGYRGSGETIPAYAPLRFDIQIVAKPE